MSIPKKVYCYNTDKVYDNIDKAAKEIGIRGITPLTISLICNRHREHIKGYRFQFIKDNNGKDK